jgi:molybdopterin-guanine dinucleotide biosynthesis protein A
MHVTAAMSRLAPSLFENDELLGEHDICVVRLMAFHPLSAVYRRNTLAHVETLLAADRLRPAFLFEAVRTRRVQPVELASVDPQLLTLRNLNTPEDYRDALAAAGLTNRVGDDIR